MDFCCSSYIFYYYYYHESMFAIERHGINKVRVVLIRFLFIILQFFYCIIYS